MNERKLGRVAEQLRISDEIIKMLLSIDREASPRSVENIPELVYEIDESLEEDI